MDDDNNFKKLAYFNNLKVTKNNENVLLNITKKPTKLNSEEKAAFDAVEKAQLIMNKLFLRAMQDTHETFSDPIFTEVLDRIRCIKGKKSIHALFIRTDYLFELTGCLVTPKQVEINTISCAFLFQGPILNKIHKLYVPQTIVSNSDEQFLKFIKSVKFLYDDMHKNSHNMCLTSKKFKRYLESDIDGGKSSLKNDFRSVSSYENAQENDQKEKNNKDINEIGKNNVEYIKEDDKNINKIENNNVNSINKNEDVKQTCQYVKKYENSKSVGLMVDNDVSFNSSNILEKLAIINKCKENNIDIFHVTFDDIRKKCIFLNKETGKQIDNTDIERYLNDKKTIDIEFDMYYNNIRVFFVYYRWYYNYEHYTEEDIILRALIECSSAVSLPSVELQILGLKIFQIRFKNEHYLLKFLSQEDAKTLLPFFGDYYKYTKEFVNKENKKDYVLKTLNEGGGNNLYDDEILKFDGDPNRVFFMKKINGISHQNTFVNDIFQRNVVPEIGVMGWLVAKDDVILYNENAGYICRSKDVSSNECGVSCGFGALDSLQFSDK
ncbi:hypothetical protein EDEG_03602 [Edhazardia aedis USNM 41457]|uniref:Glutathione synthetase n=1 Tax=Edhazardia aedis (strain USNM 41457) TaxID=1003232 RepID=J9D2Y4_EDHAE|nr:hypothetical protein EDEG_03602 [Edhazardia aedis USNM 41457]|eukprot:EJW01934.1 hypothetical protein EDEG_03602 [Edhazardia aedis USNM 41457]